MQNPACRTTMLQIFSRTTICFLLLKKWSLAKLPSATDHQWMRAAAMWSLSPRTRIYVTSLSVGHIYRCCRAPMVNHRIRICSHGHTDGLRTRQLLYFQCNCTLLLVRQQLNRLADSTIFCRSLELFLYTQIFRLQRLPRSTCHMLIRGWSMRMLESRGKNCKGMVRRPRRNICCNQCLESQRSQCIQSFLFERPYMSDQYLAVYYTVRLYTCLVLCGMVSSYWYKVGA